MSDWEHANLNKDGTRELMDWINGGNIGGNNEGGNDGQQHEPSQLVASPSSFNEIANSLDEFTATTTINNSNGSSSSTTTNRNGLSSQGDGLAQTWANPDLVFSFVPRTPILGVPFSETTSSSSTFGLVPGFVDTSQGGFFGNTIIDNIPEAAYVPPVAPWVSSRIAKDNASKAQEKLLVTLRQAGVGFEDIALEMKAKFGVDVSANALVKRYQKTLDAYLLVSPPQSQYLSGTNHLTLTQQPVAEATKSAMPDIMEVIMRELGKRMDVGQLSEADKKVLQGLQQDLPRFVQNRALRKRKAMVPSDE
ncbi:hypothetical protein OQA88_5055 [Cercophora sp. LCS_1]